LSKTDRRVEKVRKRGREGDKRKKKWLMIEGRERNNA
jgi:hypothetical protein